MTRNSFRSRIPAIALSLLGVVVVWGVFGLSSIGAGLIARVDRMCFDNLIRLTGGAPERDDLILLGIDEASLDVGGIVDASELEQSRALGWMTEGFPYDRRVYAEAIHRLGDAGARLIVVDLLFTTPSDPAADEGMASAITKHHDKVVLASSFAPGGVGQGGRESYALQEPIEPFWDAEFGFVNFSMDELDGLCRTARFQTTLGRENGEELEGEFVHYSLAARMIEALGGEVPEMDRQLNFTTTAERGGTGVYAPISLYEIFVPTMWAQNFQSGEFFKDKVVMIGPVAPRLKDIHQTPVGPLTGPQLHLQVAGCGMAGAFLAPVQGGVGWMLAMGVLASCWAGWVRRTWMATAGILLVLIGLGALVLAGVTIPVETGLLFPVTGPALAIVTAWMIAQSYHLLSARIERQRLRSQFRRFVSRDVADRLVDQPELWDKIREGQVRRVVVLFSDVRGFTTRAESGDPNQLVSQLNEYFTAMVAVVFKHGGTLDKFIGDAVMAHWGAMGVGDGKEYAGDALAAAREMHVELGRLNQDWSRRGLEPMRIGVGLHVGEVVAGELGSPERIEFGVIGDAVNLASRLEGLTKYFRADTVYSKDLQDAAADSTGLSLGRVKVAGRGQALELFADGDRQVLAEALEAMPRDETGVIALTKK